MRMGTFLLGALVGAGVAALMTPRTGREAQEELKRRASEFKDQYGDVIEQGRLRATELIRSGQEMLDERMSQAQRPEAGVERPTEQGQVNQEPR